LASVAGFVCRMAGLHLPAPARTGILALSAGYKVVDRLAPIERHSSAGAGAGMTLSE
jgi:XapX domain-containing protein